MQDDTKGIWPSHACITGEPKCCSRANEQAGFSETTGLARHRLGIPDVIAVTIPHVSECSLWLYSSESAPKNDAELARLVAELPERKPTVRIQGVDCQLFQRYVASIRLDALVQIGPRKIGGESLFRSAGTIPVAVIDGVPAVAGESLPPTLTIASLTWSDRASVLASLSCSH